MPSTVISPSPREFTADFIVDDIHAVILSGGSKAVSLQPINGMSRAREYAWLYMNDALRPGVNAKTHLNAFSCLRIPSYIFYLLRILPAVSSPLPRSLSFLSFIAFPGSSPRHGSSQGVNKVIEHVFAVTLPVILKGVNGVDSSKSTCQQVPIVNTTSGLLRGFSPYPDVHAYLGIPFAEPPIGDLRFAPPQPLKLNYITAFSDRSTGTAESEDMLSINIWSRLRVSSKRYHLCQSQAPGPNICHRVLRDNIRSFGGDPSQMTLMGHSAGSMSIAYWSYAYKSDPIVAGLIELSGQPGLIATDDGSSWIPIANSTVCSNADASTELVYMKTVPARSLKRAMSYNNVPTFTGTVLTGGTPAVDNATVFPLAEYTTRGLVGDFAQLPLLITNTMNEADGVLPFPPLTGVNQTLSDLFTLASFHCPVAAMANYTSQQALPTWRYIFNGTFAETTPYP
ncbi:uncharacterized protein PAC_08618 [Phialocephala subalpina]|uniref:Carboxylic ester hydrolase n=1 Tax=Phialocephala subalpina TaxID=576137 RepID=A0A1L7X128_9HELO|nr:uncharacterized protein PAC_08618 [Phialocephala subalpina]